MSHYGQCNFPESIFRLCEQGGVSCTSVSGFSRWSSSGWDAAASTYISCGHMKAWALSRLPRLVSANTLGAHAAVVPLRLLWEAMEGFHWHQNT